VKQLDLKRVATADLVKRYAATGIEEDNAEKTRNQKKRNQLRMQMFAIAKELKQRPGDQRRALISLYGHPNVEVQLMAAKSTLVIAPEEARRLI
jgi:hypothetical protein